MRLKDLYPTLTQTERDRLASAAGIKPEYLYQLASGFRRSPSLRVFASLIASDARLTLHDLGDEFCGIAVAKPPVMPAAEAVATPAAPIPDPHCCEPAR